MHQGEAERHAAVLWAVVSCVPPSGPQFPHLQATAVACLQLGNCALLPLPLTLWLTPSPASSPPDCWPPPPPAPPQGDFLHNTLQQQRAIVNCLAVNEDGVMVSGGGNGSLWFWDWTSGNVFQQHDSIVQPGSLEAEAGVFAMAFDQSGSRLVTCEADKTIKMWRQDESATPESHPVVFRPPKDIRRF